MYPSNSEKQPIKPIQLSYGPESLQFGELYLPGTPGPYPIVILIHGGYWRARYGLSLMRDLAKDLAKRGIAAWNIEYRRVGDPGGAWPETLLDVARAADYLRVFAPIYNLDLNRVVAIGHSAGGHLGLWLAGRPKITKGELITTPHPNLENEQTYTPLKLAGAISLAGVVDLQLAWELHLSNDAVVELLGGNPADVPERYATASPAALLPIGVPQVLIHGTADVNVPPEVSRTYAEAARNAEDNVTLIELPEVDHFALIDPHSEAWNIIIEALQDILKQRR